MVEKEIRPYFTCPSALITLRTQATRTDTTSVIQPFYGKKCIQLQFEPVTRLISRCYKGNDILFHCWSGVFRQGRKTSAFTLHALNR